MKLSVVVTGYGKAKWWRTCLESLRLVKSEIEIICVDDASGDGETAAYLNEVSAEDSRVKVLLRKENGGVCVARNDGMAMATGELIGFADYDDVVLAEGIDAAVAFMSEESALDVCAYGVRIIWEGLDLVREDEFGEKFVLRESGEPLYREIERRYVRPQLMNYVWNKIYRAQFLRLHDIRFVPHSVCYEDIVFNLDCLVAGAAFGGVPGLGYTWVHHAAGTTLAKYRPWIREGVAAFLERHEAWLRKCGMWGTPWAEEFMDMKRRDVRRQIEENLYRPGSPHGLAERIRVLREAGRTLPAALVLDGRYVVRRFLRFLLYRGALRRLHIRRINPTAVGI